MSPTAQDIAVVLLRHLPAEAQTAVPDPEANLADAGLDSLRIVGFLLDLERTFGIQFSPQEMNAENFQTIQAATLAVTRAEAR